MTASATATARSDRTGDDARSWAGFTALLASVAAGLFLLGIVALLLVDPYDTGRTGIIRTRGLQDQYPFTANASRARDPRFDAAIFGNSHVQQLRPERLDALTGRAFVSLIMPATYPADTLDMLRWFATNRRVPARAVVLGIDQFWCYPDAQNSQRFPAWLYAARFTDYLVGLVRYRSFEAAAARLKFARSGKGGYRPDGFWDYEPIYDKLGLGDLEASRRKIATRKPFPVNTSGVFPALMRLKRSLAALPAETAIILVRPPLYRTALPEPGPETDTAFACRAEMSAVAGARPSTALVDLFGQDADNPDAFYDQDHYRDPVAIRIEREIADALARISPRADVPAGSGSDPARRN